MEGGFTQGMATAPDGTVFAPNPDLNTFTLNIYRYKAAEKRIELWRKVPYVGGERTPTALSPNGWIYGTGTWLNGSDSGHKAAAYGFNPATGEVRSYGPVGPRMRYCQLLWIEGSQAAASLMPLTKRTP
jgi:hypothetical protein